MEARWSPARVELEAGPQAQGRSWRWEGVFLDALRRIVAVILGDDVLPGAATAPDARAPGGDRAINDHHGHPGGDEALRQVARLLSGRVRSGDLVARLGGDEFAVLLPDADLDRAVELAERLRAEAAQLVPDGFGPDELSLSLGVAAAGGESAYPLELMSRADEQLYRAKITRNAVGAPLRDTVVPT